MREDMAKVMTERPRTGGRGGNKGRKKLLQQTALEDLPTREGIHAEWFDNRKRSNIHLKPLRRYLKSQAGRPWDQVYSAICHAIDADCAAQRRVFFRLGWEVEQSVCFVSGEPFSIAPHYRLADGDLYVHPDTGVLTIVPARPSRRRRWQSRTDYRFIVRDDEHRYVCLDGNWFEVTFAPLPPVVEKASVDATSGEESQSGVKAFDLVLRRQPSLRDAESAWGSAVFAVQKRQLSKKEIKCRILPALALESAQ